MFTNEQENELRMLHIRYCNLTKEKYPDSKVFRFSEIVKTVMDNAKEDEDDFYSLIKGVLEAMIYTSENTVEEMIERAEADFPRRYQEMSEEQKNACDNYRIPYKDVKNAMPWEDLRNHPEMRDENLPDSF